MKLIVCAALIAAVSLVRVDAQTRYNSQPGKSDVKVDGTSTFHAWEMEGRVIGGYIELEQGVEFDQAKGSVTGLKDGKIPAAVRANIAVTTLHSKAEMLPDVMDHLMQDHMKATNYPTIRFSSTALAVTNAVAGKPFEVSATGQLSIAGVTNSVTFPVTMEQVDPTHLHVTGKAALKMTDFKVEPPAPKVAGIGAMKTGDEITILIDWTLQKRTAP